MSTPTSVPRLPGGPSAGRLAQTVALHRDPLGTLRRVRAQHGDTATLRLTSGGPLVTVTDPDAVRALATADHGRAAAGDARRHVVPQASPHSAFAGDDATHRHERAAIIDAFAPEVVAAHRGAFAATARAHAAGWPCGRPFALLPRLRALVDDAVVAEVLGVRDPELRTAIVRAIGGLLHTPGNPPLSLPGPQAGVAGRLVAALYRRRERALVAPLAQAIRRADPLPDDAAPTVVALLARRARGGEDAEDLARRIVPLLMAAQEPAAAAHAWLVERLLVDPSTRARYLRALGTGRVAPDDPEAAADVDAIIDETLRLRPAAFGLLRTLHGPLSTGAVDVPAGTVTAVPLALMHRDPRLFDDPERFDPDRARDGGGTPARPFGDGPRRCLGEALARVELSSIVPSVLGCLDLRLAWPRRERMVLRGTILVPHRGLLVVARAGSGPC